MFEIIGKITVAIWSLGVIALVLSSFYRVVAMAKGLIRIRYICHRYGKPFYSKFNFWMWLIPYSIINVQDIHAYTTFGGIEVPLNGFKKIRRTTFQHY